MFNDNLDFYPTPEKLAKRMLAGIDFKFAHTFLEPSAGSGNIVRELKEKEKIEYPYREPVFDIDCIERDARLQSVLRGEGFRVIYNDFLSFETMKEYDVIFMNPPFSDGAKHLLKAMQLQERNGGGIVCILNAETLKNPYSAERKAIVQKLEDNNADIEYIQEAFIDGERKTNVEIALIRVKMPETERTSFILDGMRRAAAYAEDTAEYSETHVAEKDLMQSYVRQFNAEVESGIRLINEYRAMQPFLLSEFEKDPESGKTVQCGSSILKLSVKDKSELSKNAFVKAVRRKYWKALFHNEAFVGKLTENLKREFYKRIDELQNYDFSVYNIKTLQIEINQKMIQGVEDTIIALFEELSNKYHYYDETSKNIHYFNGWKTNKAYIINKKVVIPLDAYNRLWGTYDPADYRVIGKLSDIEKALNYLDGGLTDSVDLRSSLEFAEEYGETKNIVLKYFNVTFYKKGTCHITFTNDELWKKFNIFGAQRKGWLPPCYGKKKYKDMTTEEKEVINSFEGEKSYSDVMEKTDYFMVEAKDLLPLLETA